MGAKDRVPTRAQYIMKNKARNAIPSNGTNEISGTTCYGIIRNEEIFSHTGMNLSSGKRQEAGRSVGAAFMAARSGGKTPARAAIKAAPTDVDLSIMP